MWIMGVVYYRSKVREGVYVLSSSLSAGMLYTASQVLVEPGMQKPNWNVKLFTSYRYMRINIEYVMIYMYTGWYIQVDDVQDYK